MFKRLIKGVNLNNTSISLDEITLNNTFKFDVGEESGNLQYVNYKGSQPLIINIGNKLLRCNGISYMYDKHKLIINSKEFCSEIEKLQNYFEGLLNREVKSPIFGDNKDAISIAITKTTKFFDCINKEVSKKISCDNFIDEYGNLIFKAVVTIRIPYIYSSTTMTTMPLHLETLEIFEVITTDEEIVYDLPEDCL